MTKKLATRARKPTRKRRSVETSGIIQIKRPIDLRFKLSLTSARGVRVSLERALAAGGRFSLRLNARDLHSIYIYLGPAQMKKLAARLAALELSEPKVSR